MSKLESISDCEPSLPAWWGVVTKAGLYAVRAIDVEDAVIQTFFCTKL